MGKRRTRSKLPKIGKRTVQNQFEFDIYKALKNLLPKGAELDYETEKLPYTIQHNYLPDFVITKKNGEKIYIEAKGNGRAFTSQVRQKMIAVRDQLGVDIRIVFYSDGKVGQKRKDGSFSRQSDWASKNKFLFSIKEVPKEWFNE